jgi:hypothetical protein
MKHERKQKKTEQQPKKRGTRRSQEVCGASKGRIREGMVRIKKEKQEKA